MGHKKHIKLTIMKNSIPLLSIIALIILLTSCEKKEDNPLLGTWEATEVTNAGSVVARIIIRADMTLTYTFITIVSGVSTTVSNDYTYSYTETEITVSQAGGQDEVSDYVINGNELTLSENGTDAITFTKVK